MVFAADKISKARELRREPAAATHSRPVPQPPPSRQRALTHYRQCLDLLEDLLTDSPLVEQLRNQLEIITSSPMGTRSSPEPREPQAQHAGGASPCS